MANFLPLKSYIIFCITRLAKQHGLSDPFLDAGCGIGDVSRYLASCGWQGVAVDSSPIAFEQAAENLKDFNAVRIEKKSLLDVSGAFRTVFLLDALEHFEDDTSVLKKIASLLVAGGHAVITVPSNPREWRWDDEMYGHYRRYTPDDIKTKLQDAGLEPLELWDFTFPVFWLLRRLYTALLSPQVSHDKSKSELTAASSAVSAWHIPFVSDFIAHGAFIWTAITKLQFALFRNCLRCGHEMIVLARKKI